MITLLSILFLGFFLGMRHATDSDHVIAVTTIVSRQRSIGSAALTGVFWGVGHSLTLLVVGGAIVFFGIVIPERLGLSLEFCVALMLILLGALNLRVTLRSLRSSTANDQHEHVHRHGDYVHTHPHGHAARHAWSRGRCRASRAPRSSLCPAQIVLGDAAGRDRRSSTVWPDPPLLLSLSYLSFSDRSGPLLTCSFSAAGPLLA